MALVRGQSRIDGEPTGEQVLIEYQIVRYQDSLKTVYYMISNVYSCELILGVYSLQISNTSRSAFISARMEQVKFESYNDTCWVERTSFLIHGGKLRKLLEGNEDLIITSLGQGKAASYIMNDSVKQEMLKIFIDKPKDIKSTL